MKKEANGRRKTLGSIQLIVFNGRKGKEDKK